jgi:hypothetical protein
MSSHRGAIASRRRFAARNADFENRRSDMPTRLSVTIDQGAVGKDGETKRAELAQAVEALERVAQALMTTQATSGTVTDRNGNPTGHWTYIPSAAV